jgi:hypothetical protein
MQRTALLGSLLGSLVVPLVFAAATPAHAADRDVQKFEKSFPLDEKDHKIGIKAGDVTIESVQIKNWPDAGDFAKGEKDLNDTHTVWVVFTYTNRNTSSDYKCKYTVTVPNPKGGTPWGENDSTRTLDKGKVGDTNRFGLRMKTHQYKLAKSFKVNFEVWKQ